MGLTAGAGWGACAACAGGCAASAANGLGRAAALFGGGSSPTKIGVVLLRRLYLFSRIGVGECPGEEEEEGQESKSGLVSCKNNFGSNGTSLMSCAWIV